MHHLPVLVPVPAGAPPTRSWLVTCCTGTCTACACVCACLGGSVAPHLLLLCGLFLSWWLCSAALRLRLLLLVSWALRWGCWRCG